MSYYEASAFAAWAGARFAVRPGLTGLWQVSGRSNLGFDDWVTLDLKYIDEWSLAREPYRIEKIAPSVPWVGPGTYAGLLDQPLVDFADGIALDGVVGLLGVERVTAGHASGEIAVMPRANAFRAG